MLNEIINIFETILNSFQNVLTNQNEILLNILNGSLTKNQLTDISIIILTIAIIFFVLSIIILIIFARKTREEKIAKKIISEVHLFESGEKKIVKKSNLKENDLNLKQLLVKKFQPVIEKQLKTSVIVEDFGSKNDKFVAKINVQNHKLELVLDSSGQIIDYKRL